MKQKNNVQKKICAGLCTLASLIFLGCATSGPKFTAAAAPAPGKALIYVYRAASFVGAAGYDLVYVNTDYVATIRSGGYAHYEAPQGTAIFYLTPRAVLYVNTVFAALTNAQKKQYEKLRMEVEPGKTYYVKIGVAFSGHDMEAVDEATAVSEISGLHLAKAVEAK